MMTNKLFIAAAACAMMLAGCDVDEPIYNTPHPDYGAIILTTDWSSTNTDTPPATGYTVAIGDYSAVFTGTVNRLDNLFTAGEYTIYVHNTADNISVGGTTATANYESGELGWLYTSAQTQSVTVDTDHEFTAAMTQQVGELTLVIEPDGGTIDRIATIEGEISGIAGTLDYATGTHGQPTVVHLTFSRAADPDDANWYATVRLLGITGNSQNLDITVTYNDDSPSDQMETYDLNTFLTNFNSGKATPFRFGSQIETPTEADMTGTITDWVPITGGDAIAN